MDTAKIQSVDRALGILETICQSITPLSVKEISDHMNLKRPTVNGLVATLLQNGYICRDSVSGKYSMGIKLFSMCHDYPFQRRDLQPLVSEWTNLSTQFPPLFNFHMGLFDGTSQALVVRLVDSPIQPQPLHVYSTMPLYASGLGKCLMAYMPELQSDEFLASLNIRPYTAQTIVDWPLLRQRLSEIRAQGYSVDEGEYLENTYCFAFPVLNEKKQIVASLSISSTGENILAHKTTILQSGLQVSKICSISLGWKP